jgi:5-methylcytosine-specific restriction enzyme A
MPLKPATICRDCTALALAGSLYCARHQESNRATRAARDREADRRANGLKSFYDGYKWRRITQPFILNRDPLCKIALLCEGRAASTDVDHIIRVEIYIAQHAGDPTAFYDIDNLQGACHADHSRKTILENQGLWPMGSRSAALIPSVTGGGQNL